jgi:hypothetical protein
MNIGAPLRFVLLFLLGMLLGLLLWSFASWSARRVFLFSDL